MAIEERNVCFDAFQLYLDGTPLTTVKQMKYLGVLLDAKFSWKQHLSYISEKCDKLQRGLNRIARHTRIISYESVYAISGFPPIDITILHNIAFGENFSASSFSNYDCILSPFYLPHPSERNAINIIQCSD
ncbi:uncharacterized protein TNCV_466171 [Trichonephila clavipes]|nr:uncharacterized protein TNCV_466171 [Trichonephila clavipes]